MSNFIQSNHLFTKQESETIKNELKFIDNSKHEYDALCSLINLSIENSDIPENIIWDSYVEFQDLQLSSYINAQEDITKKCPNIFVIVQSNFNELIKNKSKENIKKTKDPKKTTQNIKKAL